MVVLTVEDARQVLRLVGRGLGAQPDLDEVGNDFVITATVGRKVFVEIRLAEAMGQMEVLHRIGPVVTSTTLDKVDDLADALRETGKRLRTTLTALEGLLQPVAERARKIAHSGAAVYSAHVRQSCTGARECSGVP